MGHHASSRILPLDGLRGIAAVAVAVFHFQRFFSSQVFMERTYLMVDLFFILSGIVLTHVYEKEIEEKRISFREFFVNRLARLYPVHLMTLAAALAIEIFARRFLYHGLHTDHLFVVSPPLFTGFLNVLLLQSAGIGPGCPWIDPSWSVSVEVVVNFFWFWLIFRRTASAALLALLLFSAQFLVNHSVSEETVFRYTLVHGFPPVRGLLGFLIGCLFYRHLMKSPRFPFLGTTAANLTAAAAVATTVYFIHHTEFGTQPTGFAGGADYPLACVVFPLLILTALHPATFLNKFLTWRPMLWLGGISYSLYLIHHVVGTFLLHANGLLFPHIPRPWIGLGYLAIAIPLSWASYELVEKPMRSRIKSWFPPRPLGMASSQAP